MIQRIQSVFLAICAIFFILFLFLPLKQVVVDGITHPLTALSGFNTKFSYTATFSVVSGFIFLGIASSIATIMAFKQRYLQIRLCYVIAVISLTCILLLDLTHSVNAHSSGEVISVTANALLGATILLALLASVYIKKDINLLKRADRIR